MIRVVIRISISIKNGIKSKIIVKISIKQGTMFVSSLRSRDLRAAEGCNPPQDLKRSF